MIVTAILVAAGSGLRLGADVPKAFVSVAGRTLIEHAADRFAHPRVRDLVIAAPPALVDSAAEFVPTATVVPGGRTRQDSVARALAAVRPDVTAVLVHDVARAFVPPVVIDRVLDALAAGAAAVVPAMPITDTVRRFDPAVGELGELVDRARLLAMQTPQGFERSALVRAHASATDADATDDAALIEALGGAVTAVDGDPRAFKLTVPLDVVFAEAMIERFGPDLSRGWRVPESG